MSRARAKDNRTVYLNGRSPNLAVGLGSVACDSCGSDNVFDADDRPESCRMCGRELPEPRTVASQDLHPKRIQNKRQVVRDVIRNERTFRGMCDMTGDKSIGREHGPGTGHGPRRRRYPS